MQQCIKILLFLILNEAQHVSGDTPPIIRSLKLHKQPLVLHTWKVVGRAVVGRCQVVYVQQLHVRQPSTYAKPEAVCAVLGSWWWGGVSPETCWASFKIRNNKILIHCCILLVCHCRNCTMMHGSTNIRFKGSGICKIKTTGLNWAAFLCVIAEWHRTFKFLVSNFEASSHSSGEYTQSVCLSFLLYSLKNPESSWTAFRNRWAPRTSLYVG